MNPDKVVKLAEQAGLDPIFVLCNEEKLTKLAVLVHNEAIESAARTAEEYLDDPYLSGHGYATNCASLILELKHDPL